MPGRGGGQVVTTGPEMVAGVGDSLQGTLAGVGACAAWVVGGTGVSVQGSELAGF